MAHIPIPDFLLAPIVEAAFIVIKKLEAEDVPSTLRRISTFDSKALAHSTARTQILQSMKTNPDFAARVEEEFFSRGEVMAVYSQWSQDKVHDIIADAATRNDLPLVASIVWMKKPEQYEFALGLIVAYSTVSMIENEQRDSQRAQETRLVHLENAVDKEKSRADLALADSKRLEDELREERRTRRSREQRLEVQISALEKQAAAHGDVTARLKEGRDRQMQRVEREASRAQELEARLKIAHEDSSKKSEKITQLQNQLASALSSDIQLSYEDLQNLIIAQNQADTISHTLLNVMNKTRSILNKEQSPPVSGGRIERPSTKEEPTQQVRAVESFRQEGVQPTAKQQRVRVVIPPGMSLESTQALEQVFGQEALMVLIDGYNVSLNNFGDLPLELQRERTVSAATNIESRFHPSCVIVFDGQSSTTRGRVQSKVHVVFSPSGMSADDVIIERIKVTPLNKPILVVTSDKNLAARAKGLGCETIASAAFVACAG